MVTVDSIQWTDRYGGRMPSGLRGCYRCEAMGCYPVAPEHLRDAEGRIDITNPVEWEFVTCPACHGTARVSWLRTLARIPRWFVRGLRFMWRTRPGQAYYWTGSALPRRRQWALVLWSAWGADLGLACPGTGLRK